MYADNLGLNAESEKETKETFQKWKSGILLSKGLCVNIDKMNIMWWVVRNKKKGKKANNVLV